MLTKCESMCRFLRGWSLKPLIACSLTPTIALACYMKWGNEHLSPLIGTMHFPCTLSHASAASAHSLTRTLWRCLSCCSCLDSVLRYLCDGASIRSALCLQCSSLR